MLSGNGRLLRSGGRKIASLLCFVVLSSVIAQGNADPARQDPQRVENRSITYKGLKFSVVGIKREKEFCYMETASNLPCSPFDDKVRAKTGEELILVYVSFERLPEFQETKLSISHWALSDMEGKEYAGIFENKSAEPFGKEVTLGPKTSVIIRSSRNLAP